MSDFEEYSDIALLGKREAIAKYGKFGMNIDRLPDNTIRIIQKGIKSDSSSFCLIDETVEFLKNRAKVKYFVWDSGKKSSDKNEYEILYSGCDSVKFYGLDGGFVDSNNGDAFFSFIFYDGKIKKGSIRMCDPEGRAFRVVSNISNVKDWAERFRAVAASVNLLINEYHRNPAQAELSASVPQQAEPEIIKEQPAEVIQEEKAVVEQPNQTVIPKPVQQVEIISVPEEIKKYKELFDMGAITQEEFDAKKKQLLGL